MTKYHLTEKGEPGVCRAKAGNCPLGADDEHYSSKAIAQQAYERIMEQESLPVLTKGHEPQSLLEVELLQQLEVMEFERIEEFAQSSPQNHALLGRVIETRAAEAVAISERLRELDPTGKKVSKCDRDTYKNLKKEFDQFKNRTAAAVEFHCESSFFRPVYKDVELSTVGEAKLTASHIHHSREWYEARFDSVGGSDVGALVVMDFEDPEVIMYWDRKSLEKVEHSKIHMPTLDDMAKSNFLSEGMKGGALYRGTVWEARSRDQFAKDHPDLQVLNTKSQYVSSDREWQQVNFDGVLASPKTGKPEGVLELKTGNSREKWEAGPPLSYRAQTLYYLNATKLPYAYVGATINDGEFRYFKLYRDDPVAPGKFDGSMEEYIVSRIEPWFENLKKQRS